MQLSECVCCVAVTFKMTGRAEQRICIKVCIKLERSSMVTTWMIQKAAAMGNWWLAASSWQHAHLCITSHAEILAKYQITQVIRFPYSPDLALCNFWLFPKLKSPWKRKRFQTIDEIQENTTGQLMVIGRFVWGPKVPTLRGLKCHCPVYNVSCAFFNKCLFFIVYDWVLSGQNLPSLISWRISCIWKRVQILRCPNEHHLHTTAL